MLKNRPQAATEQAYSVQMSAKNALEVLSLHTKLKRGSVLEQEQPQLAWNHEELSGRLIEISGQGAAASLTAVVRLAVEAQRARELVAWVGVTTGSFYPPDLADSGIDLSSLVVVRVPRRVDVGRAAERLVRSGSFGLVILELGAQASLPTVLQGRLVSLAQQHDALLVCVTDKNREAGSVGSMVSLRAEAVRRYLDGDRFECRVNVLKDKRSGPGWGHRLVARGPAGIR